MDIDKAEIYDKRISQKELLLKITLTKISSQKI